MIKEAAVLGAGSWGTGLSVAMADRGLDVILYGNETAVSDDINLEHRNSKYLPEIELSERITCSTRMEDVSGKPLILVVVPSQVAGIVLTKLKEAGVPKDTLLLNCTKGIDPKEGKLMHELIAEIFPDNPMAVLSGPSHAEEVANKMATLATIGTSDPEVGAMVQDVFTLPWFRTYTTDDVIGIEIGGVL